MPKLKTLEQLFKEKSKEGFEIVGEVKGQELVGLAYDGPFDELDAQNAPFGYPGEIARVVERQKWAPAVTGKQAHRVLAWKDVGETEGTGIVHIAPGCGKEDFLLGREQGVPPVAPLDESGLFVPGFGELTGKSASSPEVVEGVINSLKAKGLLFATEMYPHKYPHCWRCKQELLYRLVDEWFIGVGPKPTIVDGKEVWTPGFRTEIAATVDKVTFLPEDINGKARELDWLRNMGDWMISKKRYWGLALPIWVDDVDEMQFEVIGSREELKARAVEGWTEFDGHTPHRPWVDGIKIRNPKTGNLMSRISDVGNPWLDAGIVAFSTLGHNRDRAYWDAWYPADFITESFPGQFRNWFYALLAMSTMMSQGTEKEGTPPFKSLLGHGLVRDQYGDDMHKSAGNAIEFNGAADSGYTIDHELKPNEKGVQPAGSLTFEVVEKEKKTENGIEKVKAVRAKYAPMSADVIRWLYCRHNPAANINFGPVPADELRAKFILKLWNTYAFFCNYARLDNFDPNAPQVPVSERPDIDRWILSDLQLLIKKAHEAFGSFNMMSFCLETEKFVDDKLSNWYVRRNRRRFWKSDKGSDKQAAYQTLYTVLATLTKLIAPVTPFLAESMWQNLSPAPRLAMTPTASSDSVHLCAYPVADESLIDERLSETMGSLLNLVSLGSAARNKAKIKVRQPLATLKVLPSPKGKTLAALLKFDEVIADELNIKSVVPHAPDDGLLLRPEIKLNMKVAAGKLGPRLKEVQALLASFSTEQAFRFSDEMDPVSAITLTIPSGSVVLMPSDFFVDFHAPEGWVGIADHGTQVALDTRITPELAREGMARDVIRQVQELRKNAGLEMEDRIALHLGTDSENLKQAIEAHRGYIGAETLTKEWPDAAPGPGAQTANVKIEGQALSIALRRI